MQYLISTAQIENIELAFQLAQSQNVPIIELLKPWKYLLEFTQINEKSLTQSLCKMLHLERLIFINKEKRKVSSIPDTIGKLKKLKSIVITEQLLQSIPESIGELSDLTLLSLYSNNITSIPYTTTKTNHSSSL